MAATPGEKPSFSNGIKALLQSKDFWILFLIHGLNVGLSIALGNIFTQVIAPYGYTDVDAGQLNALGFVAGTIGCSKPLSFCLCISLTKREKELRDIFTVVAGPVLDKTKQHILFLRLIAPGVLVSDVAYLFLGKFNVYRKKTLSQRFSFSPYGSLRIDHVCRDDEPVLFVVPCPNGD